MTSLQHLAFIYKQSYPFASDIMAAQFVAETITNGYSNEMDDQDCVYFIQELMDSI